MKRFLFLILLVTVPCVNIKAQGVIGADPALAAAWYFHTSTSKAAINGATAATAATIPEIKWYESKTREYVDYRYKYYNYLDNLYIREMNLLSYLLLLHQNIHSCLVLLNYFLLVLY